MSRRPPKRRRGPDKNRHTKHNFQHVTCCKNCRDPITLNQKNHEAWSLKLCPECFASHKRIRGLFIRSGDKEKFDYETYMKSHAWRRTRNRKLRIHGRFCNRCDPEKKQHGKKIEVHHLTYERLGKERMSDLEVLCKECHDIEHPHRHRDHPGESGGR